MSVRLFSRVYAVRLYCCISGAQKTSVTAVSLIGGEYWYFRFRAVWRASGQKDVHVGRIIRPLNQLFLDEGAGAWSSSMDANHGD